jgi:hypothetical protein
MLGIPHLSLLIVKEKQQLMKASSIGCCSSSFLTGEPKPNTGLELNFRNDLVILRTRVERGFVTQNAGSEYGFLTRVKRDMAVFLEKHQKNTGMF